MGVNTITYKQDKCKKAVIIGYNVSYGNDPQPLYEAGSKEIQCVVEMEALAQVSISKAIFDSSFDTNTSGEVKVNAPSLTLDFAVVKFNFSASSGQAYVVEQLNIVGKVQS